MDWLELSTQVDREAVEAVSELLSRHAYGGGIVVEEPILAEHGGDGFIFDLDRPVVVKAYLPLDAGAAEQERLIAEGLWHLGWLRGIGPLETKRLAEEDWANAWRAHYQVHRIGRRVVVKPSWQDYQPRPDDVVVALDPGMAFGTGLHPTTQLCLRALERYVRPGACVLDVGTGSGILAIAAAKLGAASVLALDVDSVAVAAAKDNIARNDLLEEIEVRLGTADASLAGRFDLVVANLTARIIMPLAHALASALAPRGILLVSGIIADQASTVRAALRKAGLRVLSRRGAGDWLAYAAGAGSSSEGPAASRRPDG